MNIEDYRTQGSADEQNLYNLHRDRPDWLPAGAEFDGDRVLGWALITERVPGEVLANPVGYMVIADGAYIETDLDGVPYRVKSLKMLDDLGASDEQ